MLEANRRINPCFGWPVPSAKSGPNRCKETSPMIDVLNLALPYFSLIFIGFACGKAKKLSEQGLAWMNFFLLYVSLPALLFGIMSKTPFDQLNNPPFLVATTLCTSTAFALALSARRLVGRLSFREATLAGLSGAYGNIGYMGPGLALAVLGAQASAPTALIFCCDSIFLFSIVPLLIALSDSGDHHWLHALGLMAKQIVLDPLILSACAGGSRGRAAPPSAGCDRQYAVVPAKRGRAHGAVCARRDGCVASARPRALAGARGRSHKTPDPSAGRVWIDAAARAISSAMGSHRRLDGFTAAGAECFCHSPPE